MCIRDRVHTDRAVAQARGYRDVIAPPTFAVLIAQRAEMEFIFDPEAGVDFSPVSYTHLDVYKRQTSRRSTG